MTRVEWVSINRLYAVIYWDGRHTVPDFTLRSGMKKSLAMARNAPVKYLGSIPKTKYTSRGGYYKVFVSKTTKNSHVVFRAFIGWGNDLGDTPEPTENEWGEIAP